MERSKLLKFLKSEANRGKIVRMSLREIALEVSFSRETVRIVLAELEALGKIEVTRSKNRRNIIKIL